MRLPSERAMRAGRVLAVAMVLGMVLLPGGVSHAAGGPATVTSGAFATELEGLSRLADACAARAAACDTTTVPGRQGVTAGAAGAFRVSWEWLAEALKKAHDASGPERVRSMQAVQAHLAELAHNAAADRRVSRQDFEGARAAAVAALQRDEFRTAEGPSWLDRQLARLQDWFLRMFSGVDRLGRRAPWLAPLVEWSCFGLAAAGLLYFVQRNLRRQALRISLTEGAVLRSGVGRDSADWAKRAEEQAATGQWRDAVHSLFWAAVTLLEGRRLWRADAARTPREYGRLLRPGTEAQQAFRALTQAFERSWYGVRPTTEAEFLEAAGTFAQLRTARTERAAPTADRAVALVEGA